MAQPSPFDTIVAPITGAGRAGVAVIRVSGPEAWKIAQAVFQEWPPDATHLHGIYGRYTTGDDGIALPFEEGRSYTGDATVELSCHGSPAAVRNLVDACLASGARLAEPGEFTQRAFLNGRIDLTQAEAVRDTVDAQTDSQLRYANLQREGSLYREVSALREEAISLLAAVEASVDFSEEVGDFDRVAGRKRAENLLCQIEKLLLTAETGRIMRQGLRVAIVGPPNAGKSSLLNRLLGTDRSIVTDVPGTTRDFVEEAADLGGVPCILVDTAGLRDTVDEVESMGVTRSRAMAENADLVWYVYDASTGWGSTHDQAVQSLGSRNVVLLANKSDLESSPAGAPQAALHVSAQTGAGLDLLIESVKSYTGLKDSPEVLIHIRHVQPLARAREAIANVIRAMENDQPDDLLSVGLQDAIGALGEVTGETASPEIIERIFHDFCIGK